MNICFSFGISTEFSSVCEALFGAVPVLLSEMLLPIELQLLLLFLNASVADCLACFMLIDD